MQFSDIYKILAAALDAILPRTERSINIERYTIDSLRVIPEEHAVGGKRITTVLSYRDRATEDLIRAVKYDGSAHASHLLAEVLEEYLREELSQLRTFSAKHIVLVPIPLHSSRLRERGFNQIEKILGSLSEEFRRGPCRAAPLLKRIRATPPQTKLSRAARLKNVQDAFAVLSADSLKNTHVILIDDVTTTGATLCEAAKVLEKHGATVSLLALARA